MTDAYAGYDEPTSPDRKLATDRRTRGADDVDLQQIVLFDKTSENGAAVSAAGRLSVDASGVAVPVTDNGSSLTIDGTVTADTEFPAAAALADGAANPTTPMAGAAALNYNESSGLWERQRNNLNILALTSAARTATTASSDQASYNGRGVVAMLNVTAASGTGGLQVQIQGKHVAATVYYACNATPTAVTATGLFVYEVYPGIGAASGGVVQRTSGFVPKTWRINVIHGDGSSYTYSVYASLIL